jgi:hypothetical protein
VPWYGVFGGDLMRVISRAAERKRHAVESDDRLIEEIRAGRVSVDDPDPVAAMLARWRLGSRSGS